MAQSWTPERRKAFGEKMKQAREARTAETKTLKEKNTKPSSANQYPEAKEEASTVSIPQAQWEALMAKVDQLEQQATPAQIKEQQFDPYGSRAAGNGVVGADGRPAGFTDKYPITPSYYPDPRERLSELAELKRFAFNDNYVISWKVDGKVYETKWGTNVREPFFYLTLHQRMFDEFGEDTGKSVKVQTIILTEDELAAQQIMNEMGIDTTAMPLRQLLNEVRYERIKRWLVGIFKPSPLFKAEDGEFETVIDGKVVSVSENSKVLQ